MTARIVTLPPESPPAADGSIVGGWWRDTDDGRILCELCPRACHLNDGDRGFCFVRENRGGEMRLTTYGRSTGFCVDPIEKKPLNHFYPGTAVLSFGTAGCNLGCKFCQNWDISKSREVARLSDQASPDDIAAAAKRLDCVSVAYTYNDPVIWAEYAIDTARACRERGIKSVAVTAGYITREARGPFFHEMDAANVDLKAFTEDFYYKLTSAHIQPVLDTLEWLKRDTDVWFEITNLIIPQANDSDGELRQMCDWVLKAVGDDVPVHFTAFHPDFKMLDRPRTPHETLLRAYDIATSAGIKFAYVGNVNDVAHQSTYCPKCKNLLIERNWHELGRYDLNFDQCQKCGESIPGRFEAKPGTWGRKRLPVRISDFSQMTALPVVQPVAVQAAVAQQTNARTNSQAQTQPSPTQGTAGMAHQRTASRPQLTEEQERVVHRSACEIIAAAVRGKTPRFSDESLAGTADLQVAGAFVTAKRQGRLRGCCGSLGPAVPLAETLKNGAVRTALDDNRMPPISPSELPYLHLDVYLLFGLREMTSRGLSRIGEVEIGKHGLRIQRGNQAGLLLPSVAVENDVDAEGFLRMVCRKAGLPSTAWKDDATQLLTFEGHMIEADFDADIAAEATSARTPVLTDDELQRANQLCRENVIALTRGAIPNYYMTGVSDGTVVGVAVSVHVPGRDDVIRVSNFNLRPGIPLQSTMFKLCEASADVVKSLGLTNDALQQVTTGLTILDDATMNGSLAEPDLAGINPANRAVLAIESVKNVWRYDRDATVDDLVSDVAMKLNPIADESTSLFSLAVQSTESPVDVSNVPTPKAGADIRPPAVAGTFYPADADELNSMVDELLETNGHAKEKWPAVMVPHAGLRFSGRLAAAALQRVEIPKHVIVIGPKHTRLGVDWAVAPHQTWQIPGATIASDVDLAKKLADEIPKLQLDAAAHQQEHAIEIELPLLARLAPDSQVIGIAIGGGTFDQCGEFADGLVRVIQSMPEPPLLVISSDMNHFASDDENRRLDELALSAMERLNSRELFDTVRQHDISMCGLLPAVIVMRALEQMGGLSKFERTGYATSADVTGDRSRVVGYAGMLLG